MWVAFSDEDGPVVYNCCWPSPAQSFSDSSLAVLVAIFRCPGYEEGQVPEFVSQRNKVSPWPLPYSLRTDCIEDTASNSSTIVARVSFGAVCVS
jgi:hypothetical protein